jgi:cardiolipin synthase
MDLDSSLYRVFITVFVHGVLAVLAGVHAMMNKRDPRAAIGWIAVCFLFPLAGPVLYFFFGINRVRIKARTLRPGRGTPAVRRTERSVASPLPDPFDIPPPECFGKFFKVSEKVTRLPVTGGNTLQMFEGGEEAYPSMLESISQAEKTVYLSTYIFRHDETGLEFVEELQRAHKRGVDVRVLLDGVGEFYSFFKLSAELKKRGVPMARFLPPGLLPPTLSINLRNHRKILCVDSRVCYVGSMNIGSHHMLAGDHPRRVRDIHFRMEGNGVRQVEHAFLEDWNFAAGGERPLGEEPVTEDPWGPVSCRTVVDGPDENLNKFIDILLGAISSADRSICIMTPYFLPPREMIAALNSAALRGVEVNVILPEKNNLPFVHWATRNLLWELLMKGVRIFYQPPPFAHSKVFVADNRYSLIGSANIDPRSLRLNFEIGVEVFDEQFSTRLCGYCEEIKGRSKEVTLQMMDARPFPSRLRDSFFWLFSPYL